MTLHSERRTSRLGLVSSPVGPPHAGSHQALLPTPRRILRRGVLATTRSEDLVTLGDLSAARLPDRLRRACRPHLARVSTSATLPVRPSEDGGAGPAGLQGLAPPTSPVRPEPLLTANRPFLPWALFPSETSTVLRTDRPFPACRNPASRPGSRHRGVDICEGRVCPKRDLRVLRRAVSVGFSTSKSE
jgi:hypothetical protein